MFVLGELGLDGSVRAVRGVLATALLARQLGLRGVLVPASCAAEAAVVDGIEVYAAAHVAEVIEALAGRAPLPPPRGSSARSSRRVAAADMSEVRGKRSRARRFRLRSRVVTTSCSRVRPVPA